METYTDTPYKPFKEEATDALLDKEHFLVALGTAADTVKLATSIDDAIGVLVAKHPGDRHVNARVTWGAGAKVVALTAVAGTYRTLGMKLSQGNSADGDIVELLDTIETRVVA